MIETPPTLPCVFCGLPTTNRYSFDMDLPAIPACNATCLFVALFEAGEKRKAIIRPTEPRP